MRTSASAPNPLSIKLAPVQADPLAHAFPPVDPGVEPAGHRVLVQIRTPKGKTEGGIILVSDTKDTEKWNTQVAKVVALGPLAFKKRDTMESWKEGDWCAIGDFVRVPKYGGDRWEVPVEGKPDEPAMFVIFNDHDIIGRITCDPLKIKAFV
jgi:co-chaperonin GroES (HSP10)